MGRGIKMIPSAWEFKMPKHSDKAESVAVLLRRLKVNSPAEYKWLMAKIEAAVEEMVQRRSWLSDASNA